MVISPSLHDHDELLGVCAIAPRRVHLLCWATSVWHGTIEYVTSRPAADPHLQDLARLRRVRDRIDREYARPLDVEALARGVNMSAGHLSRQFRQAYGEPPYAYLMTRRIERAMAFTAARRPQCHGRLLRGRLQLARHFQQQVHRIGGGFRPSVYRREAEQSTAGMPSCVSKQVTRPVRNREAQTPQPQLT